MLARKLFPGGIEVRSTGLDQAIRTTKELVANPEVPAIFEGVFEHDGVLVRADVLQRREENLWRLLEVKSASDLKDHYVQDVAIQSYVLSRSGLKLASSWLVHINRAYVLTGTTVDPRQFFSFRNLTQRAQQLPARTCLAASLTISSSRDAGSSRRSHRTTLHQSGRLRVLHPLQCPHAA